MLLLSLSLLLAKNRFVLSDLAGRLSSCEVLGQCISWSRGIENTVNISSLQMPGCSFSVSVAIGDGRARGKVCGGVGQTSGHQEGGRSKGLLVELQKELLAGGCYEEDMTEDKVVRLV